jgi:hypothetical protein
MLRHQAGFILVDRVRKLQMHGTTATASGFEFGPYWLQGFAPTGIGDFGLAQARLAAARTPLPWPGCPRSETVHLTAETPPPPHAPLCHLHHLLPPLPN